MTTDKLIAASAVGGFILTLFVGAIAGTFVLGTTFATQEQVTGAVAAGIAPLATEADVAREIGSLKEDLAGLPTRDDIADLIADAVNAGIAEAIAPLTTKEDLAVLSMSVETINAKANALIDCISDLDGPRTEIIASGVSADPDAPVLASRRTMLPNSCQRAQALARDDP